MKLLSFEAKKIRNKRLLSALIIVPVIVVLAIFISRLFTTVDFQKEEQTRANLLLADLSWQLPTYREVVIDPYIEVSEEDQLLYDLVDEAERHRFNYSVSAYYEDWHNMNIAKQNIWELLLEIVEIEPNLRSLNADELLMEKNLLDWAVDNEVGTYDFESDTNSLFILYQSFSYLFSLPALMLIVFFFCLPIFLEPNRPEFNFSKVLPITYPKMMVQKLILFMSIFATYISSAVGMSLILAIFDSTSLKAQLQYPMMVYQGMDLISKPLWQVLLFQILFFAGLGLLSLSVVTLFSKLFKNDLFISFMYTVLIMIGLQVTRLTPSSELTYNPIAWFDSNHFILYQRTESIAPVLLILFTVAIVFAGLVLLRPLTLPRWQRKPSYRGIEKLSKGFLIRFESLKIHRQAILFYSTAILTAFTLYHAVDSYQDQTVFHQQTQDDFYALIDQYEKEIDSNLEAEAISASWLEIPDLPASIESEYEAEIARLQAERKRIEAKLADLKAVEADVANYDYSVLKQLELSYMKNDYEYVTRTGDADRSEVIPTPDPIFIPNAYINYRLSQYKFENKIDFVSPGAPYQTLFIPTYHETPRSGEDQAPAMVELEDFEHYLAAVNQEHHYLSGLNLLADFFNQHYYLVLLILLVGFYSLSYVREWDGQGTIRYLLTQPISLTKIFTSKVAASLGMGISFTLIACFLIFLIGSLLNGVGQPEFPFIQYVSNVAAQGNEEQLISIPMQLKFFQIIPLWKWLLIGAGLLLTTIFMINQLVYFVSTFLKNQWAVMAISLAILGLGFLVTVVWPSEIHAFLPFQYLDIDQIVTGEVATLHEYRYLNWQMGMIVQTVTGIILMLLSLLKIRRIDSSN